MEIIEIIAIAILAIVIVTGVVIKRHTKKSLKDIDGMGRVSSEKESKNSVAKF